MILFLIILICTLASAFVLPWWAACVIAFIAGCFIVTKPGKAFLAGFCGISLAWVILALIKSVPNDNMLANRVAHTFQLPGWLWILTVTAVIGGLTGGMAAMSGAWVRKAVKEK